MTKITSAAFETVAAARIAPKICQGEHATFGSLCSRFHPNQFTFGGVSRTRQHRFLPRMVFPIFARSDAWGRITSTQAVLTVPALYRMQLKI